MTELTSEIEVVCAECENKLRIIQPRINERHIEVFPCERCRDGSHKDGFDQLPTSWGGWLRKENR